MAFGGRKRHLLLDSNFVLFEQNKKVVGSNFIIFNCFLTSITIKSSTKRTEPKNPFLSWLCLIQLSLTMKGVFVVLLVVFVSTCSSAPTNEQTTTKTTLGPNLSHKDNEHKSEGGRRDRAILVVKTDNRPYFSINKEAMERYAQKCHADLVVFSPDQLVTGFVTNVDKNTLFSVEITVFLGQVI